MNNFKTYLGIHDYFATGEGREVFWCLINISEDKDRDKNFYEKLCKISNREYSSICFDYYKNGFDFYDISEEKDLERFKFDYQNKLDGVGFDEIENIWIVHKKFRNSRHEFIKYSFLNIS